MTRASTRRHTIIAEYRAMLRLAWPLIVAQLAIQGQGVIEVMLAGHFDAHVLGAVAIGANLASLPLMAMIGTMYALPPTVAQLDGAGRRGELASVLRQALWLALAIGFLMLGITRWALPPLLALAGVAPDLAVDATAFLHAVSLAMPAIGLWVACRGLTDGLGLPVPSMVFNISALFLLLPAGFALMYGGTVFGFFAVPRLGAAGTGYAAALVDWLMAALFFAWLRLGPRYRDIGWSQADWRPDLRAAAKLLRLGVPMGVSVVSEVAMFSAAALAIGRFGDVAAASHQVALNVAALTFMVPLGLAYAITVRVGNAAGRGDPGGVRRAGFAGISLALATQAMSSVAMLMFPESIAAFYTDDPAVIAGGGVLLRIAGVFQLADGLQVASSGALRGLKDTRVPMLLTAVAYWGVGLPLGLLLAFGAALRAPGMWVGLTFGLAAASVLLCARLVRLVRSAD
jgi:MATE family multidrug resistance protein